MINTEEYEKARKLAGRAYRNNMLQGIYPYLPVLDEVLSYTTVASEQPVGLVDIPLHLIIGTKTAGRTQAFAGNFLPLLDTKSEFAAKWCTLYDAHLKEGIRDPISVYEFMHRFYVVEGNKRVSVLKYLDAVSIPGYVTRILPQKDGSKEVSLYYEFLDFYQATSLYDIWCSEEGNFARLLEVLGFDMGTVLSKEEQRTLSFSYYQFRTAFLEKGGARLKLTPGDAFLIYLTIFGYEDLADKPHTQLLTELEKTWSDFALYPEKPPVELVLDPLPEASRNLLSRLWPGRPSALCIAFVHYKTPETSNWTYGHELGRQYVNDVWPDQIKTYSYDSISNEEEGYAAIEAAIEQGCQVIFTTTPELLGATLKAAIQYPDKKILNCSLNVNCGHLRTYYGRLHEAKFLTGMLAGALTDSNQVGYIADYPINGMIACINAFALGLQMVNPKARLILEWATVKNRDIPARFRDENVSFISDQDSITPSRSSRRFGLYDIRGDQVINVASPIWHWGKFYERVIRSIFDGTWNKENDEWRSINYWWGLSSGMIDVICSPNIPAQTLRLMETLKGEILADRIEIFSGELRDQRGELRSPKNRSLSAPEIITQSWLLNNVVGSIPTLDQLTDQAKPIVQLQGVHGTH